MTKKIIAVDIDDVLAREEEFIIAYSNKHFGHSLTAEDYDEHWGGMWGVDLEETERRADMLHEPGNVTQYRLHDSGREVLERLKKRYRLVVLTSRRGSLHQETLDWMEQHFAGVFDEVKFTGFWDTMHKDRHTFTKGELLREMGADYVIDDQLRHCISAAEAGIQAILFGDRLAYRNVKLPATVTRCLDWQAVEEYFDGIK